MKGRSWIFKRK